MELYKQYLKEREDIELIYNQSGFISYYESAIQNNKCIHIEDLFVQKEMRGSGIGQYLGNKVEEIAIRNNINYLTCNIIKSTNGWQNALRLFKIFGFEVKAEINDKIFLVKQLNKSNGRQAQHSKEILF